MTKLLLIGGNGQLGREIQTRATGSTWKILAPAHYTLDITSPANIREHLADFKPDWVFNLSGFHDLAFCENNPRDAFRVNVTGVGDAAKACSDLGAAFLTVSTDYVFDGAQTAPYAETDVSKPLQVYGKSKRAGEQKALDVWPEGVRVIRTCGLYSAGGSRSRGGNFIDTRLTEGKDMSIIEVGCDLICTPTHAGDCASAILQLASENMPAGLYHLTNDGACSWADFTAYGFSTAGLSCHVKAVDRNGDYGAIKRPRNSVLDNEKVMSMGIRMRPWQDALNDYIRNTLEAG